MSVFVGRGLQVAGLLLAELDRRDWDAVVGVDVSAPMLDAARALDRTGGRCTFVLNEHDDLRDFADAEDAEAVRVAVTRVGHRSGELEAVEIPHDLPVLTKPFQSAELARRVFLLLGDAPGT